MRTGLGHCLFMAAALISAVVSPARAQQGPPDLTRGEELAENICALCHDVTLDASEGTDNGVPSFLVIANKPLQSDVALVEAIVFPHPDMPDVTFTTTDLRDMVAYILSLRSPGTQQ